MMFSAFHELNGKPHRDDIITNLTSFDVITLTDKTIFTFYNSEPMLKSLPEQVDELYFCATDDPLIEWAGDWRDMGCFGLIYSLRNGAKITNKQPLTIECANVERTLTVPAR